MQIWRNQLKSQCKHHSYPNRIKCLTPSKKHVMSMSLSRSRVQRVCSQAFMLIVTRLTRLTGGWPRAFSSSVVVTIAWSIWKASIAVQTDGWLWPISWWWPLFHDSHSLFAHLLLPNFWYLYPSNAWCWAYCLWWYIVVRELRLRL